VWYTLKDFHPIRGPKKDTQKTTKWKIQNWGGPWSSMQTQKNELKMTEKGYTKDD
jgi:hypothetical protein